MTARFESPEFSRVPVRIGDRFAVDAAAAKREEGLRLCLRRKRVLFVRGKPRAIAAHHVRQQCLRVDGHEAALRQRLTHGGWHHSSRSGREQAQSGDRSIGPSPGPASPAFTSTRCDSLVARSATPMIRLKAQVIESVMRDAVAPSVANPSPHALRSSR